MADFGSWSPSDAQGFLDGIEYDYPHAKRLYELLCAFSKYPRKGHAVCVYIDPFTSLYGSVGFSRYDNLKQRNPVFLTEDDLAESYKGDHVPDDASVIILNPAKWPSGWISNPTKAGFCCDVRSPKFVLEEKKAICSEGALTAIAGIDEIYRPRLLILK